MNHTRFRFRIWDNEIKEYLIGCFLVGGEMIHNAVDHESFLDTGNFVIEQCTGLKDKNGNLIYEGDVVRCSNGNIYNICWSDSAMIMVAVNTTTKIGDAIYKLKCYDEFEIIGNIHEQKEQQ